MQANELIHHFATALLESAARQGISVGLPLDRSREPGAPLWTGDDFVHFLRIVGSELDDAFFGLAGSKCPTKSSQFGVELMVLSDTLGEALDRYARFYEVLTDGLQLKLGAEGRNAWIEIIPSEPERDPSHFLTEWYITRLLGISQWLIGQEIPQVEVEFSHSRNVPISAYTSVLSENVSFDQPTSRIILPSRFLNRRVIRDLKDLPVISSTAFDPEHPPYQHRSWRNLLKSSLRASLYRMEPLPTMEDLAKQFGVSSQTLRRGLKTEGTSYRQIKAEARREVVVSNISDTSMTLSQISVLAGFAETNGLVRAMKSWTGLSLSAFRRSVIEGANDEAGATPDSRAGTRH